MADGIAHLSNRDNSALWNEREKKFTISIAHFCFRPHIVHNTMYTLCVRALFYIFYYFIWLDLSRLDCKLSQFDRKQCGGNNNVLHSMRKRQRAKDKRK